MQDRMEMLYKDDTRVMARVPTQSALGQRPPHCEEFKACLQQALKILEERYEV
jgi:hypothetical protein